MLCYFNKLLTRKYTDFGEKWQKYIVYETDFKGAPCKKKVLFGAITGLPLFLHQKIPLLFQGFQTYFIKYSETKITRRWPRSKTS